MYVCTYSLSTIGTGETNSTLIYLGMADVG